MVKATQNNNKNSLRICIDTFGKFWNCIILNKDHSLKVMLGMVARDSGRGGAELLFRGTEFQSS